jgi:uncharacterized membrane protein
VGLVTVKRLKSVMEKSMVNLRSKIKADFDVLECRLSKKIVETTHRQTKIIGAMIISSLCLIKILNSTFFHIK